MTDEQKKQEYQQVMEAAPQGFKTFLSNHQHLLSLFQLLPIPQNQRDIFQATVECTLLSAYITGEVDRTKELIELAKTQ